MTTQTTAQDVSDQAIAAVVRKMIANGYWELSPREEFLLGVVMETAEHLDHELQQAPVVGVTDEMVIAACLAYEIAMDGDVRRLDVPWIAMKAALESALTGRGS